jgi:hypothetical protein
MYALLAMVVGVGIIGGTTSLATGVRAVYQTVLAGLAGT